MYRIVMQKEGRGDNAKESPIKRVTKLPGKGDSGELVLFPIKFPCLKVVAKADTDKEDEQFDITWSNYGEKKAREPGKFKLKRIANRPVMLYEVDSSNGRKVMRQGKPVVDYVGMAKRWGSEWDGKTFTPSPDHPTERTIIWENEAIGFQATWTMLVNRFGESLAREIFTLFLGHELFQESLVPAKAA